MRLVAREAITPTNLSPVFVIVTWVLQAAVILAVTVKVLLLYTSIGLHQDDWCILVAAALSIGQVVAVSFQGINGIGKVQATLPVDKLIAYQKAGYAGELLYILALAASKISVVFFIYNITPFESYRRISLAVGLFIVLWTLATLFAVAFQCHGPSRWAIVEGKCFDQIIFWTIYASINILTELSLMALPLQMFVALISSMYKKTVLIFCFCLRFTVVAAIAIEIYFLHHPVYPSTSAAGVNSSIHTDFTFGTWPAFLTAQITLCLSIITTCIPFMKSLFVGMRTGMIQTGHVSGRNLSIAGKRSDRGSQSAQSGQGTIPWLSGSLDSNSHNPFLSTRNDSLGGSSSGSRRPSATSTFTERPRASTSSLNRTISPMRLNSTAHERSYSRREVSMIREEDEEPLPDRGQHIAWADRPSSQRQEQDLLGVNVPSGQLSPSSPRLTFLTSALSTGRESLSRHNLVEQSPV